MTDDRLRSDIPHPARVYDYFLGGKDNYQADRAFAQELAKVLPLVPLMMKANRLWMNKVIQFLAEEKGIRQFLDIGTGLPGQNNLHQIAQGIDPTCRVVYVDNDPLVLVHARALLTSEPLGACAYVDADLREPQRILDSTELQETLDLTKPVALTLIAVLMLISNDDDPWAAVRTLMDALPSGSYVAISHPTSDMDAEAMAQVAEFCNQQMTFVPRSYEDVKRFFAGWEMVGMGVVPILDWRPRVVKDDEESSPYAELSEALPNGAYYWAGVARKP